MKQHGQPLIINGTKSSIHISSVYFEERNPSTLFYKITEKETVDEG